MRCELRPFRLALRAPLVTGGVSVRFRAGFLVALSHGAHTGWGEASPLPGWSSTTVAQTSEALDRALGRLHAEGRPALGPVLDALSDAPHARAAVAGARADLLARESGRTLAACLLADPELGLPRSQPPAAAATSAAGAARAAPVADSAAAGAAAAGAAAPCAAAAGPVVADAAVAACAGPVAADAAVAGAVAVNALITAADPARVEQQALAAVRDGFGAVKLKVGAGSPAADVDRVRAARSGLGSEPELRLDANGAWDRATAVGVLARVEPCRIAFCEEPVPGLEAMAAVSRSTGVPAAADESMRSAADAEAALRLGIDTLVVKPQALGGPDTALAVASRAFDDGAAVVVTSFLDGAIGVAHALHAAAAVDALAASAVPGRGPQAHGLATSGLLAADTAAPPRVGAGLMHLPPPPGLGVAPATRA